jgi:hypothetical protein
VINTSCHPSIHPIVLLPAITSDTKKKMWIRVAEAFNSESVINREPNELSKKWDNLVQTHRPKYLDYKRQVNQTGKFIP